MDNIKSGFVIESLTKTGDFMNKSGDWEKNNLENAHMFLGGPSDVNDLLKKHKSFFKVFRIEEIEKKRVITQRMTVKSFVETKLPWE